MEGVNGTDDHNGPRGVTHGWMPVVNVPSLGLGTSTEAACDSGFLELYSHDVYIDSKEADRQTGRRKVYFCILRRVSQGLVDLVPM